MKALKVVFHMELNSKILKRYCISIRVYINIHSRANYMQGVPGDSIGP